MGRFSKSINITKLNSTQYNNMKIRNLKLKIPCIILNGAIPWFSNDFFVSKVPNLARLVEKNPEQSNATLKQTFYQTRSQNLSK